VPKKKDSSEVRRKNEFIKANQGQRIVRLMCRLLGVAGSGYCAGLKNRVSDCAREDARLPRLLGASYKASQCVYGATRAFLDLREAGETCSKHRVARLMRENNMRAAADYHTRRHTAGKPARLTPNLVKRNINVSLPGHVWITNITCVRTWEGWLYFGHRTGSFLEKGRRLGRTANHSS
jgi:putative transposase